jgi:anti-sigma B factor antagonist
MFSVELSTREWDGHIVVALDGELDLVDAADVAAALVTVTALEPEVIMDLAALEFIDSSGVAALVRGRAHARHAGGDLLLAAPQQSVLRILAITRLADNFSVHASVEEAAASARRSRRVVVPLRRPRRTRRLHTILPAGASPLPRSRTPEPMPVEDGPASQPAARITAKSALAAVIPFPGCGDDR